MYNCACSWHPSSCMRTSDMFVSQTLYEKYTYATNNHLLWFGNTCKGSEWKDHIQLPRKAKSKRLVIEKRLMHLIKAVGTIEPELLVSGADAKGPANDMYSSHGSDCQASLSTHEVSDELDEKEKTRRLRISKANSGNTPWNKGKKHSPETLRRIRERTRLAMQDPKVKMKLVNFGHAQSEETKKKIAESVRKGWERRRQKLMIQEGCFYEWQAVIAEAAREGFAGGAELQWDSYGILDEQLRQEWSEGGGKRRQRYEVKVRGSRRAPKSAEQKRKIAAAIYAKWADPVYRERVLAGISKRHTGHKAERPQKEKPASQRLQKTKPAYDPWRSYAPKREVIREEMKNMKSNLSRRKRTPSYKDPMATAKLEMIKQVKAKREAVVLQKREAVERAKALIHESLKAAKALETAAITNPIVQESLVETRRLIAEAMSSIESIEEDNLTVEDNVDATPLDSSTLESNSHFLGEDCENLPDSFPVNGTCVPLNDSNDKNLYFDMSALQTALNGSPQLRASEREENLIEGSYYFPSLFTRPENVTTDSEAQHLSLVDGSVTASVEQEVPGTRMTSDSEAQHLSVVNGSVTASVEQEVPETCMVSDSETKDFSVGDGSVGDPNITAPLEEVPGSKSNSETEELPMVNGSVAYVNATAAIDKVPETESMTNESVTKDLPFAELVVNGAVKHVNITAAEREDIAPDIETVEVSKPVAKSKKKWVRGKLVDVEE